MKNKPSDPFGLLAFLHWNDEWNKYHFNEKILPKAIDQIQDLGIKMVRMDILWSDVEKIKGKFDFSKYDSLISALKSRGIQVLGLLEYNRIDRDKNGKEIWSQPPEPLSDFINYVEKTVDHFKRDVRYWEVWNEPNHPLYWSGPKDNLKAYCRLLKESYEKAKEVDPRCIVLNGGLTDPLVENLNYLYDNGGKDYTDMLSIHTFVDPLQKNRSEIFESTLNNVYEVMKKNGDETKPVWITEMGCPGMPSEKNGMKWFAGESVDEETQSEWLKEMYAKIKETPFVKIFWAFYRDTDEEFKDRTDYLGLVKLDLKPKKSFYTLQTLIKNHSD